MITKEDWMNIKTQREQGIYQKDIAKSLGVHPRTIHRALLRGKAPTGKRPKARKSKLDPYKPAIDRLLGEGVWNAVVILREIEAIGYNGEITILRNYIRPKRTLRKSLATVRFESPAGEQMQNDWGEIKTELAGITRKVVFQVNTLSYSRRFHFLACERMDAEHTYEGIIRAFEYFGGVTKEVLVDNQKSIVIEHRIGERVKFNERFIDMAGHYGFKARACRPNRARTKGKDERMVGYVKNHFFLRYRSFESLEHLNRLAERWLCEEADPRVHGTVKEVVKERFEREAPLLMPLPQARYDTSYREVRWVAWDGYIDVRGNRYSVPDELRGEQVVIRITLDDVVKVYWQDMKVTEHRLRPARQGWVTVPSHHESLWRETLNVERRELSVYEEVARCTNS